MAVNGRLGNQETFQRYTQQKLTRAMKEGKSRIYFVVLGSNSLPLESEAGLSDSLKNRAVWRK